MFRNKEQNKRLHLLLAKNGIDRSTVEGREIYEDMIYAASNGRTKSSSKLLINECQGLINNLEVLKNQKKPSGASQIENTPENKQRRKILSICREMGGEWFKNGSYNWKHIDEWLMKYGYLHKKLNKYSADELPKLVTQFQNMLLKPYAKR